MTSMDALNMRSAGQDFVNEGAVSVAVGDMFIDTELRGYSSQDRVPASQSMLTLKGTPSLAPILMITANSMVSRKTPSLKHTTRTET